MRGVGLGDLCPVITQSCTGIERLVMPLSADMYLSDVHYSEKQSTGRCGQMFMIHQGIDPISDASAIAAAAPAVVR